MFDGSKTALDRKVVLVTRKTRLEDLIAKYLTPAQARFYVEHLGADFSDYQREHDVYQAERRVTVQALEQWGRYQVIDGAFCRTSSSAPPTSWWPSARTASSPTR